MFADKQAVREQLGVCGDNPVHLSQPRRAAPALERQWLLLLIQRPVNYELCVCLSTLYVYVHAAQCSNIRGFVSLSITFGPKAGVRLSSEERDEERAEERGEAAGLGSVAE